ncbi:aminopeptidase N [Actinomyces slackii]|uniref:Aminopeptidase N n=1 Tax=Actinomyces slackii TaxID=52774 RepID=A0A3S4SPI2_9ACTO|nr:aminopeptidase N [Actinomyces slackii]VEG74787.1 Aminopeptidase N [Actinomyces slackii]
MPGQNLTREEAIARAATVTTSSYDVVLDLTRGETTFRSTTTARFTATPGADTFIDLVAPTVHSITLNGRELDPAAVYADSRIILEGLAQDNELVVVADCAYMHTGEGLHRFTDPADGLTYLYSQFEVPDSRRVYAVFEQPDLKASFTFTVTAPSSWTVFSNSPTPEPSSAGEDSHTFAFAPTEPMSSYVTAIVAGPYTGVTDAYTAADGRTVPLGVYCRASLADHLDAEEILEITKKGFAYYEDLFDTPYAFSKYDQIFVPEFNAGAMENAGCVTHRDDYVFRSRPVQARVERRAVTILHELAHMWFGDLVTMTWWNDLWLNESFAEYISTLATAETTRFTDAWTTFQTIEKAWAYNQDQLSSTHPVAAEIRDLHDVEVNFDGITYAKGAAVLTALVGYVGRKSFFTGIANYLAAHAYANAELSDLLSELEAVSGRDLSTWTRLWLQEAGVTTLRTELDLDEAGTITRAAIRQEIPAGSPASLRPHRVAVGCYRLEDSGRLERTGLIELDVDGELTPIPDLVGQSRPDVLMLNDEDLTYAKVRLDQASLATGLEHVGGFTASLPRSLVLASAWDMVRDGELASSRFLGAALEALAVEEHSSVIQGLLGRITTCLSFYLPPELRRDSATQVAESLWGLARAAAPGSDKQLQLVRALAAHAVTADQLDAVEGLLEGGQALEGLVVDQDLRWELLIGLVSAGRCGQARIDAELERDVTTTGRERAGEARAAIPTPQAKEAAWRELVDSASMPNETQVRMLRGLTNVERDPELLAPFVAEYAREAAGIWESRTFHMAENLLSGLWSDATVGLEGLDPIGALEAWLAEHAEAPAALRRIVQENLDTAVRVAGAQAAERAAR